jgi:hypothetical protein
MRFGHKNAPEIPATEYIERSIIRMPWSGCWIWERAQQRRGYGVVCINGKNIQAHRFVYAAMRSQIATNTKLLHRCDVMLCVNPDHLYEGTDSRNLQDQYDRQRRLSVLSHSDKTLIVELLAAGKTQREVATKFGVSHQAIGHWSRKWKI